MLGLRRLEQAAEEPDTRRSVSTWGARNRLILVGLIVTAVGLIALVPVSAIRPRYHGLESISAFDTWLLWHGWSRGVDEYTGQEKAYFARLDLYRRWRLGVLVVAGVGVVILAGSLLVPKRSAPPPGRMSEP